MAPASTTWGFCPLGRLHAFDSTKSSDSTCSCSGTRPHQESMHASHHVDDSEASSANARTCLRQGALQRTKMPGDLQQRLKFQAMVPSAAKSQARLWQEGDL